jgi:glucosamine 6-phosphate synthetase-like amidotransferase/phosphosugar isomerase protein
MCGLIRYVGRQTAKKRLVSDLKRLDYHIAQLRGLDVDQPRNLAETVTVE